MPAATHSETCPVCAGPKRPRARTGRPAVYCSRACQAKAYRARVAERRHDPSTTAPRVIRLPKPTGDSSEADRILELTAALAHRVELAAGAVRHGRPLPDGTNGLDGRPEDIERIAADLVDAIRTAAVPAAPGDQQTATTLRPDDETSSTEPAEAERVVRTVDMSHEFGDGYTLVQLACTFEGQWLVRLHGETIGSVERVASITGRSVRGWEARHHGMKVQRLVRHNWESRGLAVAAVIYAHEQNCRKPRRSVRRRRPLATSRTDSASNAPGNELVGRGIHVTNA
ncbi:hypothetical protein [Streptomyces sp. NBRC 110611]|uniref:hypothetical protein n=1 Tax=Streptomyces sp. NBRC 110611 TaxID=1621259 RepID=UPI000A91813E|nr:hypothetical protein [Streptomyces sp. NBRC 110611]